MGQAAPAVQGPHSALGRDSASLTPLRAPLRLERGPDASRASRWSPWRPGQGDARGGLAPPHRPRPRWDRRWAEGLYDARGWWRQESRPGDTGPSGRAGQTARPESPTGRGQQRIGPPLALSPPLPRPTELLGTSRPQRRVGEAPAAQWPWSEGGAVGGGS